MVSAADGTAPTVLLQGWYAYNCSVAPAQVCVLAVSKPKDSLIVFSYLDPARGKGAEITHIHRPDANPYWHLSPDGHTIALTAPSGPNVDLIDVQSGRTKVLTANPKGLNVQDLCWMSDSKSMYGTGATEDVVYAVFSPTRNGAVKFLKKSVVGWYSSPTCSPDGKMLAFNQALYRDDLLLLENF